MPRPNKNAIEFRSSDREIAKKMLREYFQQKGGLEYMKNAQQPSMFQDTETGEYIARPQIFKSGGMYANKQYRRGGRLVDMLAKYGGGGKMYREYAEGGTEPEKVSAEELARRLAAAKNRTVTLDGVTRAMGDEEIGYTTAVESTARPVIGIPVGMGEPAMEESSAAPGRMEEVPIRGPQAIKRGGDRGLVGERRDIPERQERKDYGFQVLRDPDRFRHPYGKSITTAATGEETDTSGMMGVRMGDVFYYMPNARGYTGPKGKFVRDFKEIKDKFGEDAYMQALGMLQEQGADISRLID